MEHREELLKAFHIGPEDLEVNRAGKLTEPQARKLRGSGTQDIGAALVIGVLLAAILYGVAEKPLRPVQWILASVLFLAALATGMVHFRKTRAAVAQGIVECLTGPVQKEMRGKMGWYLTVEGRTFKLPVRPWHVNNEARYRVYYAPAVNLIVAMEPDG